MIGMKPGPDSIGIVAVSCNCNGVAAESVVSQVSSPPRFVRSHGHCSSAQLTVGWPQSPSEALTLARWISVSESYRILTGELLRADSNSVLKNLWNYSDAEIKWRQASPVFTFANQAGLEMLETTLVNLQISCWRRF